MSLIHGDGIQDVIITGWAFFLKKIKKVIFRGKNNSWLVSLCLFGCC